MVAEVEETFNTGCSSPGGASPRMNDAPRKGPRKSLSTWYNDAIAMDEPPSDGAECISPKRRSQHCHDGLGSPSKKGRLLVNCFIGQDSSEDESAADENQDRATASAVSPVLDTSVCQAQLTTTDILRTLCAEYFESSVAPIIQSLQESQSELCEQVRALQAELKNVRELQDDAQIPVLERSVTATQGVCQADTVDIAMLTDLQMASEKLRAEFCEFQAEKLSFESELRVISQKAVESTEKMEQQMHRLRQDFSVPGDAWPGRVIKSSVFGSDAASDVGSMAESIASSAWGWGADAKGLLAQAGESGRARLAARLAARARRRDRNAYTEALGRP